MGYNSTLQTNPRLKAIEVYSIASSLNSVLITIEEITKESDNRVHSLEDSGDQ